MKGLYLNVADARRRATDVLEALGSNARSVAHTDPKLGELVVAYHSHEWANGPLIIDEAHDRLTAGSGWFLYHGRRNDLAQLSSDFFAAGNEDARCDVLRAISAGAFVVLLRNGEQSWLVTDGFGLHPHYVRSEAPLAVVAPAPSFLDAPVDADLSVLLERNNHLFGNLTGNRGVVRLEPGAITTSKSVTFYAQYGGQEGPPEQLFEALTKITGAFDGGAQVLPLSGGLDSRLLLASGQYDYGYTFGPADSGDRPVARQFASRFGRYREFSLLDVAYPKVVHAAATAIFGGTIARPFKELFAVYRHVQKECGEGTSFDGYLGDVLQRGLYLTHGGVRGSLGKLLPQLTLRSFDGAAFLRRKYKHLAPSQQDRLAELYKTHTRRFDLDEPHRVVLFETLYGRGSRYVIGGGTIMTNQFFTAVAPFASTSVFRLMFGTSAPNWLSYRRVRQIWSALPIEYSKVRTYSGFAPTWPGDLSRVTMLATKGLAKAGVRNRARSYEDELPQVRWT